MRSRLPDFVIIGAMKSGTTTLYEHLERNPGIFMSTPKEPNFFSIDEVNERGTDWYASLFADARSEQICGEASPSYTRFPRFGKTPERMAALIPNAKLVYIMRHPVDRFYSNYVFDRSYGHTDSIREILNNRNYVLETSNYMLQIEKYLEHFPREQMLFLLLDDLKKSSQSVLDQLFDFLEVEALNTTTAEKVIANPRGRQYMAHQCNTSLQRVRNIPGMSAIKQLVPQGMRAKVRDGFLQNLPDSRIGKWMSSRHLSKTEPLTPDMRRELLNRLSESTKKLEQFLDRDLSAWRS